MTYVEFSDIITTLFDRLVDTNRRQNVIVGRHTIFQCILQLIPPATNTVDNIEKSKILIFDYEEEKIDITYASLIWDEQVEGASKLTMAWLTWSNFVCHSFRFVVIHVHVAPLTLSYWDLQLDWILKILHFYFSFE